MCQGDKSDQFAGWYTFYVCAKGDKPDQVAGWYAVVCRVCVCLGDKPDRVQVGMRCMCV